MSAPLQVVRAADGALLFHPTVGRATSCVITRWHHPKPLRFVWHHVLPETAGGLTDLNNLISLCDSCHYAIHGLMYVLAKKDGSTVMWGKDGSRAERRYALMGYQLAVKAGTVAKIPNEGSIFT